MSTQEDEAGVIPAAYSERWSGFSVVPIDEATARKRHEPGAKGFYAVALGEPVQVVGQVNRELHFVGVLFPDKLLRPSLHYAFYGEGDRLFLRNIAEWEYAGDSDADRKAKAIIGREWIFTEDGSLRIVTFNKVLKENLTETAKEPVDLTNHWEPAPEFGDWASITRPDRDLPLDQQPDWHQQLFGAPTPPTG